MFTVQSALYFPGRVRKSLGRQEVEVWMVRFLVGYRLYYCFALILYLQERSFMLCCTARCFVLSISLLLLALPSCRQGGDVAAVLSVDGSFDVMGSHHPSFGLAASAAERARQGFFLTQAVITPAASTLLMPSPLVPASVPRLPGSIRHAPPLTLDPAPVLKAILVQERPGVRLVTPGKPLAIGRIARTPLLIWPFLKFRWRMHDGNKPLYTSTGVVPVSLLIGFTGGDEPIAGGEGTLLPSYQRLLAIVWSSYPAEGGRFIGHGPYGRFVVHGGKHRFEWWEHSVNIAALHRYLWPSVPREAVEIVFVAIVTGETQWSTVTEISGLILSR